MLLSMGRNQRKKPYHRPRSRSAGTTRNYLETKAETGIEIPRIPASSAARRPIQLFPSYRTLEPSPPGGNLRFDCPLRRCWMEHLNSGIARFAPVFFNSLFTAADENLPLCMVRVKNKPQHLVFCSHFPHLLSKPRHLPVETSIQPCLSQVSGVRLASILGHREVPSRTPTPVLAPCLNPSPRRTPAQGAGPVHFAGTSVQVVDIRAIRFGIPALGALSAPVSPHARPFRAGTHCRAFLGFLGRVISLSGTNSNPCAQ